MEIISSKLIKLISGGNNPMANNGAQLGGLQVVPQIAGNGNGAGGQVSFNYPINDNISVHAVSTVATDYNQMYNPNNAIGVNVKFPF